MTNTNGGEFAKWLTRTMELQGVSGRQIARALGKDEGTISKWKNGQLAPKNNEECLRLGAILGVESSLRLLVTAGLIPPDMARGFDPPLEPLPIPEYDPERERVVKKIKRNFEREDWDTMIRAWDEKNRKEEA